MLLEEEQRSSLSEEESSSPIGSVLVVGGGIAGMQSSLDLAESGFKVYLVEKLSAIGGHMAQLDKTFPTNDCAMCTISPKLVETGRHPNIEILTNTEVLELSGEPGHFTALLRCEPRYIDLDLCVGCSECVDVCPVITPDPFNADLVERHAIYRLYPQAFPNAFAIEKRGIAPCRDACPAGQRVQGYIALIREGRWDDALRVIKMDNPFPGICGRICNHRCEDACNRALVDEPINIRALKRFVTDKVYEKEREPVPAVEVVHKERVAIIGAGPCGLTTAQDLALAGYAVTIFEAMPVAGGMLRLGVPEYRLPTEIIEREVQDILDLGIDLRLNHRVDDLGEVFEEGFEAVLIAVGAHEGVRLPIPGAQLEGVLINTHFLRDVRLGHYDLRGEPLEEGVPALGQRVLVLGGGNVAIDCARTAVRLGREVEMAFLESREEMPAHDWEIVAAEQEGVILHPSRSFERILGDPQGLACGVECKQVRSFSFDEAGRLSVEKEPDSEHVFECDTVIFSVGQRAGLAFIPDDAGVGLTNQQTIAVNPNTLAATHAGVFAAGDSVSGTAFVIEAVDSGHTAAQSIIRYLQGEALEPPGSPDLPVVKLTNEEVEERITRGEIKPQARVAMPELPVEARRTSFEEIECGYDDESAQAEAARCLACGICSECMSCTFACGRDAIIHDDVERTRELSVGAVVLAPGYQPYQAEQSAEFGFGRYPNVINALQFERLLSASGPTLGHIQRPSDGQRPDKIAFLQCIGSRDQSHDYCSAVCCMYATKEAMIAKEHDPDLDIHIFQMDMRAFSKGYLDYFRRAKERYGIRYKRCRISKVEQDPESQDLFIIYLDEVEGRKVERVQMVVLSVGMEISDSVQAMAGRLGVEVDEYGFCNVQAADPLQTSREGVYAVGPFREPKDISESVVEASGAASAAAEWLHTSRFTLTEIPEFPPERDTTDEAMRIGVFVCHCGSNIAGFLDVQAVTEHASSLPHVVHAESNLYTCSQDSIEHISEQVEEYQLNRVVVASCTPLTHQPLFRDSIRQAGLNPYLFEMANIRNQCSWVHSHDWDRATEKAISLVEMAVARAGRLETEQTLRVPVEHGALVVGGGASGMSASLSLADQGFHVHLVEREPVLGGNLRNIHIAYGKQDPQTVLEDLVERVEQHSLIDIYLNAEVKETRGFMGNFETVLKTAAGDGPILKHGVAILAIGAREYEGPEYGYGTDERILSQTGFEALLAEGESLPASVAMIQCIGPAEEYCSRICCTTALKNALALKTLLPEASVVIFHRDIRTYGFKERVYEQARRAGVHFVRYSEDSPPQVQTDGSLRILAKDSALQRTIEVKPDLLVLSMPAVPQPDAKQLAAMFKVQLDTQGFFLEAHVKLRPVDFATDGVFMAGMAHYPKLLDESMIQARAAASRAARVLSQDSLKAGGRVAVVDPEKCTGCLTCVRICPFEVPRIRSDVVGVGGVKGTAEIEVSVCQGCGSCVAECPAHAIELRHYTDSQLHAKVQALMHCATA
jgi:heterodisulfide reductase subunit A-like polyferredoxin